MSTAALSLLAQALLKPPPANVYQQMAQGVAATPYPTQRMGLGESFLYGLTRGALTGGLSEYGEQRQRRDYYEPLVQALTAQSDDERVNLLAQNDELAPLGALYRTAIEIERREREAEKEQAARELAARIDLEVAKTQLGIERDRERGSIARENLLLGKRTPQAVATVSPEQAERLGRLAGVRPEDVSGLPLSAVTSVLGARKPVERPLPAPVIERAAKVDGALVSWGRVSSLLDRLPKLTGDKYTKLTLAELQSRLPGDDYNLLRDWLRFHALDLATAMQGRQVSDRDVQILMDFVAGSKPVALGEIRDRLRYIMDRATAQSRAELEYYRRQPTLGTAAERALERFNAVLAPTQPTPETEMRDTEQVDPSQIEYRRNRRTGEVRAFNRRTGRMLETPR